MHGARFTPAILSIAVLLSFGAADASRSQAAAASVSSAEAGFWGAIRPGRGEQWSSKASKAPKTSKSLTTRQHVAPQADREPQMERSPTETQRESVRTRVPRGSSGYVAPAPLPRTGAITTAPVVQPYRPPSITTPSDKVNSAIHDYPLQKGIGNNPLNQQEFIRQRMNSR